MEKKKKSLPSFLILTIVACVMAFAIAKVYDATKDTIEAASLASQAAARTAVMENAADMTEVPLEENSELDYVYEAYDDGGNVIGYVSQITVTGFGGEIEVTVGMDTQAVITGVNVGGANFSETSGLGAKTREDAFTDQFDGKSGTLVLKSDIDSVTGASVSSGAVVSGVNKAVAYMTTLLGDSYVPETEELTLTDEDLQTVLPGATEAVWMGAASGINGWWQCDNGYVVRASGFGEGLIVVTMGFDESGTVTGIIIGDENFTETEGRGALVQEDTYWSQFIGRSGEQAYGDDLDAISGATVTSDATLSAINACMTFDPNNFTAISAEEAAAQAEELEEMASDAETEASVTEETASGETASTEASDAETEASVTEEETASDETASAEAVDAETESSIPAEEEEAAAVEEPAEVVDAETESSIPAEEEEAAVAEEPAASEEPASEEPAEDVDAETESSIPAEEEEAAVTEGPAASEEPASEEPAEDVDAETESSIPAEEEEAAVAEEPAASEEPAAEEPVATEEPAEELDAESGASVTEEEEAAEAEPAAAEEAAASEEPAAVEEAAASAEPAASEEPAEDIPSLTVEQVKALGARYAVWVGTAEGIEGVWRTDTGIIVEVISDGYTPMVVLCAMDDQGTVLALTAEAAEGYESEIEIGDDYLGQFVGLAGTQSYDEGVDAISGATLSSDWMLQAINTAMAYGYVESADAETGASVTE